ncbi:DUF2085 domain-containing protein [Candidatus Pacearchaeota archaeon]|nr:DUF2085 domain-containing protein [Candidatus Pacearchaeota archaeon]
MGNENEEQTVGEIIKETIEHNPNHYIKIEIFGKRLRPCARCFGQWIGILISLIITSPFWLGFIYVDNFMLIFVISWLFVFPAIIDWSTTKLGFRKGNNNIRFLTGYLFGTGIIIYLLVLPTNMVFKIVTFAIYEIIFHMIRRYHGLKHYHLKK